MPEPSLEERVGMIDWTRVAGELDAQGHAVLEHLLSPVDCVRTADLYRRQELFRSRVVMGKHGFGRGEYQYFRYPLPVLVEGLRTAVYPLLAPIANRWNQAMDLEGRYPDRHDEFLARCHAAGSAPRRYCSTMMSTITTVCIRTCTARSSFLSS